jgi:hypothetical protein
MATTEIEGIMITDSLITNFIKDFAKAKDLDADFLVSIKIDAKQGVTYTFIDQKKRAIYTVEDLS